MIKIKINNKAVSEILGSVLLIAIAVSAFTIVYLNVLSDQGPSPETHVTIVGKMESENVVFEHRRGEGIDIDSKISLYFEGNLLFHGKVTDLLNSASLENDMWDIGERLVYSPPPEEIPTIFQNELQISGTIVDGYGQPLPEGYKFTLTLSEDIGDIFNYITVKGVGTCDNGIKIPFHGGHSFQLHAIDDPGSDHSCALFP